MSLERLSSRVTNLKPSVTVAFTNRAKQLKAAGEDVLIFAAGEPDFDTPDVVKESAIRALREGQTKYVPTLGDKATRDAVAAKLTRDNAIPGLTGDHVGISAGGKHSLFLAMHCLIEPPSPDREPDEVLLPVPAWVSYRPIAELAGARVVEIPTGPENDFKMSADQLERAITTRSRVLVLNSPSNPCGTMYTERDLRDIADVVASKAGIAPDLVVMSDEIYEKTAFGATPHFSIGAVPEIAERTVTLNGLSKAYAMTGWRIGYAAMPGEFGAGLIKSMGKLQGQMTTNITSFNYPAIRTALAECEGDVASMRDSFKQRAALIESLLAEIPGVHCPKPTGAFYVFPDISGLFGKTSPAGAKIDSAASLCEALLDEAGLAFVPGEDFGGCGGNHVRISYACSDDQIREGMSRLAGFVGALS